ncbi:MAG: hypothetical protein GY696_19160 [Gammaproteobacteria bacterium]|nr:hypothetical protein [Gammaproteobacteria bacterium]
MQMDAHGTQVLRLSVPEKGSVQYTFQGLEGAEIYVDVTLIHGPTQDIHIAGPWAEGGPAVLGSLQLLLGRSGECLINNRNAQSPYKVSTRGA